MPQNDTKQADILIYLGTEAKLWHTAEGKAFATVDMVGAHPNLEIYSSEFSRWLARRFWEQERTAASAAAMGRALEVLAGAAVFEGPENKAFIRIAQQGDNVYLDLGNPEWHVIEVTPEGWRPSIDPPVRFYRAQGLGELPWPKAGGCVEELRPFVNVQHDQDFVLAVAWLVGALNPTGPFPIALVQGEQGSAKSTLTRVLRTLIDPATPIHATRPKSERDLAIAAHNSWVQAFDNLSKIPAWLSDAFCRLATGGGFKTRRLYSDTDEIILQLCRPQILNGIDDLATRDDLRDRGILFELPVIPSHQRKSERDLWASFDEAHPRILGALLDAISAAIRERGEIGVQRLPRMADFATWVMGAEGHLPWQNGQFLDAYEKNCVDASTLVLDHSLLARRIIGFAREHVSWDGTPSELYDSIWAGRVTLRGYRPTPGSMSQNLKRLAPALRSAGVQLTWYRESDKNRTRKIAVRDVRGVHADATE